MKEPKNTNIVSSDFAPLYQGLIAKCVNVMLNIILPDRNKQEEPNEEPAEE